MKMVQVRNVPDRVHAVLKSRAALEGLSLSDYVLRELKRIAERPTPLEMRARLEEREPLVLRDSPADAVRSERDSR
ncbi:MAG: FitA-like ribbon-helix-helix domain-containing protein [Spirochaetota bacterium]